jgi:hypothetical protein
VFEENKSAKFIDQQHYVTRAAEDSKHARNFHLSRMLEKRCRCSESDTYDVKAFVLTSFNDTGGFEYENC